MEIWYKAFGDDKIEAVKVERFTNSLIWIVGDNWPNARTTSYCRYFKEFDDAKTFLIEKAKERIEQSRKRIAKYMEHYNTVSFMQPPK